MQASKPSPAFHQNTIAMVYDFDGTLTPKSMQDYTLLPKLGIRTEDFWQEVEQEVRETGAENMLVYMRLLLDKARAKAIDIKPSDYRALAHKIRYFPGVEDWFELINHYVREKSRNVKIKHYIISAGMREILDGISIKRHFARIYASEYHFNREGIADFPNIVITDTTKTQFLFRINKGKETLTETINEHMTESERPIPFANMIYLGDGMTDVPSMALMKKNGGYSIAVHKPRDEHRIDICRELLQAKRVDFIAKADYRKDHELYKRTTLLLDAVITHIEYQREHFKCKQQNGLN